MRLLVDMNLSPRWCDALEAAGLTAIHWSRIGAATASDEEIMAYAESSNFVVLTHDLDFGAVLAATKGRKPSVVQLRADDTSPEAAAAAVIGAVRQCATELEAGALLTVDVARVRLSLLPLRD
jgi:predicted nuclease of predicted toxin-antitoxin system